MEKLEADKVSERAPTHWCTHGPVSCSLGVTFLALTLPLGVLDWTMDPTGPPLGDPCWGLRGAALGPHNPPGRGCLTFFCRVQPLCCVRKIVSSCRLSRAGRRAWARIIMHCFFPAGRLEHVRPSVPTYIHCKPFFHPPHYARRL